MFVACLPALAVEPVDVHVYRAANVAGGNLSPNLFATYVH